MADNRTGGIDGFMITAFEWSADWALVIADDFDHVSYVEDSGNDVMHPC